MPTSSKIRVVDFLANLPLFKELEPLELDRIAAYTTEVHVSRGEIIANQGDPCTGFHCVIYGRVKLAFSSAHGAEKVVEIIGPGQSFGEAVMFLGKPYIVSSQALVDTMLLHVAQQAVFEELERTPRFARKMLAGLSRRLHGLIGDVEAYSMNSGTQRVIGYLLRDGPVDGEEVTLHASKAVVASRLNLTPEHFSRILHDLAEHGLIEVHGRGITVRDAARLLAYDK
jgi:CRP/FNR family transcriptional regulator, dissimilatory nitrate respiration regulator